MSKEHSSPIDCKSLTKYFVAGSKVIVAVSGGIDSTVCAHILVENCSLFGIEVAFAYINHQLRPEAGREERFVEQMADRQGVPFFSASLDLHKGPDLQQRARRKRYEALSRIANENGYENVVTAHILDDQAETVLFRILRGTGAKGIAGIHPRSGIFIRPLLDISRKQIEEYARGHNISHVEDASNSSDDYSRNRLRHRAIPVLNEVMGFDVRPVLARLAKVSLMENEVLWELASMDEKSVRLNEDEEGGYKIPELLQLSTGRRFGVFRKAIEKAKGDLWRIKTVNLEQVEGLLRSSSSSAELNLPGGISVLREYGTLFFEKEKPPLPPPLMIEIADDGKYVYAGKTIRVERVPCAESIPNRKSSEALMDVRKVVFPLIVRPLESGDRISLSGGIGSKKLSRLMIDAKIPKRKRGMLPVVCDQKGIVWVPGIGLSERVSIKELTLEAFKLSIM